MCKLRESLYGLKQSPRAWFDKFAKAVKKFGYLQGQSDHTLFVKHSSKGKVAILIVYVDDIILTGDHVEELKSLKIVLVREFEIKDLGNLIYFLGMKVARSSFGISVTQKKYVLDLLKECGMLGCKLADTPMEVSSKYWKEEKGPSVENFRYQRLEGKLIYLSHTHPDIAFSVSIVSQFMNDPREEHMENGVQDSEILKTNSKNGSIFQEGNQS